MFGGERVHLESLYLPLASPAAGPSYIFLPHKQEQQVYLHPAAFSGQDIAPLAAPDHEGDHGQGEENRDEDEDGERIVGRVHKHHLSVGAVGEKVLVYADDVALHQWVGPVAVKEAGLGLCAQGEEVVLAEDRKRRMRGNCRKSTFGSHVYVGASTLIQGNARGQRLVL